MKVGDMVEIDFHVTQRGLPEERQVGLVVEIKELNFDQEDRRKIAVVSIRRDIHPRLQISRSVEIEWCVSIRHRDWASPSPVWSVDRWPR